MSTSKALRYIILPARGLQTQANQEGLKFLLSLSRSVGAMAVPEFSLASPKPKSRPKIKVLDSIHENGAKLVELSQEEMMRLRTAEPGIRIVSEVE